jgi:hypothetical protein
MRTIKTLLLGAILLAAGVRQIVAEAQELTALPLDQALKRAQAGGKYRMLLRQIEVKEDGKSFGGFHDFGYRTVSTCAEYTDLPKGHWVYVYPYWYIWRDRLTGHEQTRPWGSEQATGRPDTPEAGDHQTAWASSSQDGADEWLMLEYKTPVWAYSAHIYETFNPGAVVRITAFTLDGREVEVWRTARPIVPSTPAQIKRPGFSKRVLTNRIKLYLDSPRVPGWNEIDAVGLREEAGGLQWATAAHASSIYGIGEERRDPREERILQLEEENRRLRLELDALKRGTLRPPGSR